MKPDRFGSLSLQIDPFTMSWRRNCRTWPIMLRRSFSGAECVVERKPIVPERARCLIRSVFQVLFGRRNVRVLWTWTIAAHCYWRRWAHREHGMALDGGTFTEHRGESCGWSLKYTAFCAMRPNAYEVVNGGVKTECIPSLTADIGRRFFISKLRVFEDKVSWLFFK